jgi:hypothetical protein
MSSCIHSHITGTAEGVGIALLRDTLIRAVKLVENGGTRAMVINALDEDAERLWIRGGFLAAPHNPQTFFKDMADVRATLTVSPTESSGHPE